LLSENDITFVKKTKWRFFGAAAISTGAQRGVRRRNANLLRTTRGSMEDVYLSSWQLKQQFK